MVKLGLAKAEDDTARAVGERGPDKRHIWEEVKSSESLATLEKQAKHQAGRASRCWLHRALNAVLGAGTPCGDGEPLKMCE